jgi:transglutaminase-like putative cysteine protease
VVNVDFPCPPAATATPPWEQVVEATRSHAGWQAVEFQFPTKMAPLDPAAKAYVGQSFTPGRPVLAALLELNDRFYSDFRFRSGVTSISTPVSQVMKNREGVCQDFSHALISGLRGIGLPARYTSGYIRTKPPPGQTKRLGSDQSHAWVGCWLGPDHGWIDIDPTNGIVVKDEHVLLGWGRDFSDVSPVLGVILGGGGHTITVSVDLEQTNEQETP